MRLGTLSATSLNIANHQDKFISVLKNPYLYTMITSVLLSSFLPVYFTLILLYFPWST